MALTRRVRPSGAVRWEVRVYSHGRIAAQKTFERRAEAKAWEAEQTARIRKGTWIDPRRGEATVASVAEAWQRSRDHLAPRSQETTRLTARGPNRRNTSVQSMPALSLRS